MSLPAILRDHLRLPVVGSPMFIVSTPELVIAQCQSGIVGSFPALNARPREAFAQWLERIERALASYDREHPHQPSAPYAVNMIVHRSNDRLEHDLEVLVQHQVPIVITSLGARPEVNEAVHSYGGIVLHDVINDVFARKAIEKGADGVIAVAAGAGGHAGTHSPFALIQEIRQWFDGPLLLSGSIARGDAVLAALVMGADLAYVGSPFIATIEANAPPAYKQMIVESGAQDIVYTDYFSGVHGNYLKPSIVAAGLDPETFGREEGHRMNFGSDRKRPETWSRIWGAGQGIGAVREIVSTAELVARLKREYRQRLREIAALASAPQLP